MFSVIIQIKVTEIVVFSLGFVKFYIINIFGTKTGGKYPFHLGQGMSGNVRESQGNLQWSGRSKHFHNGGQGKNFIFHHHESV